MFPLFGRRVVVAAMGALAVAAAGGGDAFWLCVPLALLVASPAESRGAAAFGAAGVALAAMLPPTAEPGFGPLPSVPLVVAVIAGSVGILLTVRSKLERERSAMRRWA